MGDVSIERISYDGRRCEDDLLSNCYDLTRADSCIYHKILLHGKADDGIGGLGSYAYQIGCILAQCNRFDDDDVEDLGAVKNIKHYDEFKMVPTFLGPWAILAFCGGRLEAISCLPNDEGQQNRFIESWKVRLGFYKYFEMGLLGEALNQLTDKNSPIPVEIRKQIFASQLRGFKLFERYLTCDDKEKREMLLDIGSALGPTKDMKYLINTYRVDEINLKDCGFIKDIFKNPAGTVDFCPNPDRIIS
jgi:hypothetical protein